MLLELENTSTNNINLLLDFAKKNKLKLQLVDEGGNDYYLPGKPLSDEELVKLINKSRKSGSISMEDAHDIIRKSFHAH
jgi:hypothetical protein